MNKTTHITATIAVALSVALIAGCTGAAPEAVTPAGPAPAVSVEPTEAPAEIVVGGTVDEATARELNREFKDTVSAYQLADGTYVVVDREQPLPEEVKADIGEKVGVNQSDRQKLWDAITSGQQATGRQIIAVVYTESSCVEFTDAAPTWRASTNSTMIGGCYSTQEEAVAYATTFAAEQGANWDVVVG